MITVTINGNTVELDQPMTIHQLLETAYVPPNYLAVEINANVVPRENHAVQMVNDGDCVEVVTLVGGG
jgi:sulfur carrier protein